MHDIQAVNFHSILFWSVRRSENANLLYYEALQRKMEYKCKNDKTCEINKSTRNLCQHCRYLKCLESGMTTTR